MPIEGVPDNLEAHLRGIFPKAERIEGQDIGSGVYFVKIYPLYKYGEYYYIIFPFIQLAGFQNFTGLTESDHFSNSGFSQFNTLLFK